MALELSGIENVGEFYSGHYLTAVLEGDLKATFEKWKREKADDGKRPPNESLAALANRYFSARSKAEEENDRVERLALAQDFHAYLIEALGYQRQPTLEPLDGDEVVPVHLALRRDGNPFLWIIDAPFPESEDEDPLGNAPLPRQLGSGTDGAQLPRSESRHSSSATWREILDEHVFRIERPPRWVLFLAGSEALLIERHKWPQGKYLRFDLGELFGRKQTAALRAMAGLLHRDVLAPETGLCLHDALDENSHKHAYAVSGALKHGVRRAVELLANEAVYYRREIQKQGVFNDDEFAAKLTAESLTWLYRLLFLFYVEARGSELGAVPMQSDAYRKGYSLETLRDLELVPLTTEHARNGYFLHVSLKTLFRILNMGFPRLDVEHGGMDALGRQMLTANDMWIDALNSPLFDDDRLELLTGVRFRNRVLQEVLQLLSLSGEKKRKARGRISYAQLGINQLGAVYEGLLSYTGFFATEDLYEVASEKDCRQLSGKPAAEREALKTYFVPASRIGDYKEGEIVKDGDGRKVVHKKGTFIFRLAGRNREKSASYYTPEVLTQCLVKYALKELLWAESEDGEKPRRKMTADEILALTICEPAMGSSAFLIEAVDQLADAYLEARQEERGETIPTEGYQHEKRRVKARLATNNCYGVDLNPTAVELAKVSLWLATLHQDGKCPWFGLRLTTGNSLVGARREVFKTADVTRKGTKDNPNWLGLVPEPVSLHRDSSTREDGLPASDGSVDWEHWTAPPRPKGTIYHFLLPAEGMAAFDKDKVIKQLAPEFVKRIKEWRKEFCKPFDKKDAERLEQISDAVDRLFAHVVRERMLATQQTSDRIPVWGEPPSAQRADLLVRDQEEVAASLEDGSSAYRRLKLAMDAWCALWFWPIEETGLLPDRATWLAQMELILKGQVTRENVSQQQSLFAALAPAAQSETATSQTKSTDVAPLNEAPTERLKRLQTLSDAFRERRVNYIDECGLADIDAMLGGDASLRAVQGISDRLHFFHWPLRFAEVFARDGGFNVILGNPPWVKVEWDQKWVLADFAPDIDIRSERSSAVEKRALELLRDLECRRTFLLELEELQGFQEFLTSTENYPLLRGTQANYYKCFVTQSWRLCNAYGVSAFLHPDGVFDDPKGTTLREALYPRLAINFKFRNELKLFADIGNTRPFSACVYRSETASDVRSLVISNLFHPSTIDECFDHDGAGPIPGIKTVENAWDLRGHADRLVSVNGERLLLFAELFDKPGTKSLHARLPAIHSEPILRVLAQVGRAPRLGPAGESWATTREWHEGDRQSDGTIQYDVFSPKAPEEWIVSGPSLWNGSAFGKTPNDGCRNYRDYSPIDLESVDETYIPRSTYRYASSRADRAVLEPKWNGKPLFQFFRYAHREMVFPGGERTLIPAVIPPGAATLGTVFTAGFTDLHALTCLCALANSLVLDFFVKCTGKTHINSAELQQFPLIRNPPVPLIGRCLRLVCVSIHFEDLWAAVFSRGHARGHLHNVVSQTKYLVRHFRQMVCERVSQNGA